ncbi:MAG: hypothetical protein ACYC1C_14720 [Chloroflexota bacterium]
MGGTPDGSRLLKWLAAISTPLDVVAVEHPSFYSLMHPQLCRGYEAAGCPYGGSIDDMWRWWQEQAAIERRHWLARHQQDCLQLLAPANS